MSPTGVRSYRTQAIVLGHFEYGEADRIIKLYTLKHGKTTVIAKGVRKIRSRKAGHLQPFTRVNLMLAKGRNLDIITQAETIDAYQPLRGDLNRLALAAYVVELLDRFTYEDEQNVNLFHLLANTLANLSAQLNLKTVVHYYEVRLLGQLGFRPQLFECVDCGAEIRAEDQFISPLAGGVVCPGCGRRRPEAWPVTKDVLRYLRHLQRSKWLQVKNMAIPGAIESSLAELAERYFTYLLERKLNTPNFVREVQSLSYTANNGGDQNSGSYEEDG